MDPFDALLSTSLRAAARRVLAACQRAEVDTPSEALAQQICCLARAVESEEDGSARGLELRQGNAIARRLLDLLRSELIGTWLANGSQPPLTEALELLSRLEQVRSRLEPAWGKGLALPLSGPDALELVAEIAHDLRSPLTSILTLAETLRRGQSGTVGEVQRRQLGLIYSAALGLSAVSSDLMELAHGGSRLAEKEPAPFSVADIFESVRDIVQPMAEEKGLIVRIVAPEPDHRWGYPLALSRVLLNLTVNALKFTERGFVEVIGESLGDRRVRFSVRDSGRGIHPEALKSLYQPFRRASGQDRAYCFSITGLGLAISRRLVEAMGSELCVETRQDWGTRFHFDLDLPTVTQL